MSLKEDIEKDIKQAMLAKNQSELLALRAVKSAILISETEKGAGGELSRDAEMKLLAKAAKQRKDSAEIFQQQDRRDLADKELKELEVINRYLPQQLSEDELRMEVQKIIEESGAKEIKDMGPVMGLASKKLAGKTDGKTLSTIVKSLLSNS
jgi:uncharacterized protein YqeY